MSNQLTKEVIRFNCAVCDRKLKAFKDEIGDPIPCPRCEAIVFVPGKSTRPPPVPKAPPLPMVIPVEEAGEAGTVPVNLSVPQVGALQTKVTQKTADSMASTFLGGLLVAMGVLLMTLLGGKSRA